MVRQCETCRHWQARGGIVSRAVRQCVSLEDEKLSDHVHHVLTGLLRLAAASNHCPSYSTWTVYPDSYLAIDREPT